jgi:hypothetical protein
MKIYFGGFLAGLLFVGCWAKKKIIGPITDSRQGDGCYKSGTIFILNA